MVICNERLAGNAVAVRKHQVVSRSACDRSIKDRALPKAIIFVPDVNYFQSCLVADLLDRLDGSIVRTIISDDDFEFGAGLRSITTEDLRQPFRLIIRG